MLRVAVPMVLIGQLGRIPVLSTGTSEAPILVNDLCVLAMLAAGLFVGVASQSFKIDRVAGLGLLFAFVGAVSAVLAIPRFGLSMMELVISLAYLARWLVYFGIYLVVINLVRARDVMALWRSVEATILVFAAFGIVQSIFLPHFAQLVYPDSRVYVDWDEQGHRLVSTVLEPNIAGGMIMLILLVQLAQLSMGQRVAWWKPLLLFAALVATLSRSSFLGLFVGCGLILLVRGLSRRMVQAAGVVMVLLIPALPRIVEFGRTYNKFSVADASALSRVTAWLRALRVLSDHPLIGVGFNTYGYVQETYGYQRAGASSFSLDGGLLFVAVMTGIVGLALYVGMLYLIVRGCRQVWRDDSAPREWVGLATGIGVATLAMCVQSMFVNSLLTPFVMELLWVLWGLAFVIRRALVRPVEPDRLPRLVPWRSSF